MPRKSISRFPFSRQCNGPQFSPCPVHDSNRNEECQRRRRTAGAKLSCPGPKKEKRGRMHSGPASPHSIDPNYYVLFQFLAIPLGITIMIPIVGVETSNRNRFRSTQADAPNRPVIPQPILGFLCVVPCENYGDVEAIEGCCARSVHPACKEPERVANHRGVRGNRERCR